MLTLARKSFHRLTWGLAAGMVALMLVEGLIRHRASPDIAGNAINAARTASGMLAIWVIVLHLNAQRRLQAGLRRAAAAAAAAKERAGTLELSERHFHIMTWCLILGTLALPVIDGARRAQELAQTATGLVEAAFMCVGMVMMWGIVLILDLPHR